MELEADARRGHLRPTKAGGTPRNPAHPLSPLISSSCFHQRETGSSLIHVVLVGLACFVFVFLFLFSHLVPPRRLLRRPEPDGTVAGERRSLSSLGPTHDSNF
uniref:Transmembrane protein n=1 Tax=Oryza rufipogon TaxID=4529 RepID=A0A0E0PRV5_ORYRU